jgi:hypothetical protein
MCVLLISVIRMEGLQFDTEHASTQIGHQQMILEEYTIDD